MDRFDAMKVFARIVERRSFTKAADDLGLPRSSVTDAVKSLEARLGVKLLQRTTRQVSPTLDGEAYYRRCISLLADLEDAESAFSGAKPSGLIRVDVHGTQARYFLLPGLTRFLEEHPGIRLHISEAHHPLDLLREGVDCVLRAGELAESSMIRRRVATLKRGTFASPAYLRRAGTPGSIDDLSSHEMIGLMDSDTAEVAPMVFTIGGQSRHVTLETRITLTGPETNVALACQGFGLVQLPRYRVADELAAGVLVEVLPDHPPTPLPVHVLYPQSRQLSPRVRVFIEWIAQQYRISLQDTDSMPAPRSASFAGLSSSSRKRSSPFRAH
jgi:DNA-binding transcriptional LysR family regulator